MQDALYTSSYQCSHFQEWVAVYFSRDILKTPRLEDTHIELDSQASFLVQSHALIFTFKVPGRRVQQNVT